MLSAVLASPSRLLLVVILTSFHLPYARSTSTLQNITVDDTVGSTTGGFQIVYSPPGVWSPGQNCTTCEAGVDKSKALDGTWHDVSYISDNPPPAPITATLQFEGVAVYAFCIITRAFSNPNGNSDMSFQIDGKDAGTFELAPNGDPTYQYNFPVFSSGILPSGTHTLTLTVGHMGGDSSLALLDYFVFTQEVNSTTSSIKTSNTPSSTSSMQSIVAPLSTPLPPNTNTPTSISEPAQTSVVAHGASKSTVIGLSVALPLAALLAVAACMFLCVRKRAQRRSLAVQLVESPISDKSDPEGGSTSTRRSGPRILSMPSLLSSTSSSAHESQIPRPFIVPPRERHVTGSQSLSSADTPTSTSVLLEKGKRPPASAAGRGGGGSQSSGEVLDTGLSPGGASSHDTSATGPRVETQPVRTSAVLRYAENGEDSAEMAVAAYATEKPLSGRRSEREDDAQLHSADASSSQASPISPTTSGRGLLTGVSGAMGMGSTVGDEEDGPPPYAPRESMVFAPAPRSS